MADKKTDTKAPEKAEVEKTTEDTAAQQALANTSGEGTDLVSSEDDFFAGAGEGLDDFQQSDFLIPYVRIIQALSKELQKNHAKYVKDGEQGDFINSATRKLYKGEQGFYVVPVSFGHRYMAWRPNNAGPAYDMGDDATKFNSIAPDEKGKRTDEEGNELVDSLQFFVILVDIATSEWEMAVLNFSGSQAKKARGWSTTINKRMERRDGKLVRPAIFFYSYKVSTTPESNDQGSWYGFVIEEGPKVKDLANGREIFTAAKTLRDQITAGEVKAAAENPNEESGETSEAF